MSSTRVIRSLLSLCVLMAGAGAAVGMAPVQQAVATGAAALRPIIDVHRHGGWPGMDQDAVRVRTLAEMDQRGVVVAVVSMTGYDDVDTWDPASGRFLVGPMLPCPRNLLEPRYKCFPVDEGWVDLEWLRAGVEAGRIQVLHEVGPSYYGIAAGNPRLAPYWALAAEYDLPVGVHTQRGPASGSRNSTRAEPGCCPDYDPAMGNPALLRPVLERHPGLRVWIQHVGSGRGSHAPYWEETLALLRDFPQVHLDLSITNSAMPLAQYEDALRRLIDAGFGDRIMFGSDNLPVDEAVQRLDSIGWLDDAQRRAILCGNAARFFRLGGRVDCGAAPQTDR